MGKKIIMDCDPGTDDAIAICLAAAYDQELELLGITTVSGNQGIEKVTRNALAIREFLGLDVPVARGAKEPLLRENEPAPEVHGDTGLGFCILPDPVKDLDSRDGVLFLRDLLMGLPEDEKAVLVPTGPLTNIALLLKAFPDVKEKIEEIVFMGGACRGGNVTPSAEYNIYIDPEAAQVVCKSGVPLVMCGLDVTNKCGLTKNQVAKLCQSENPVACACGDMAGFYFSSQAHLWEHLVAVHDAVPIMYLVHPELFKWQMMRMEVDCSQGLNRGMTVCDMRNWCYDEEEYNNAPVKALIEADAQKFQEYLIEAIYELDARFQEKAES